VRSLLKEARGHLLSLTSVKSTISARWSEPMLGAADRRDSVADEVVVKRDAQEPRASGANRRFSVVQAMERTGIEPVTSGLQT
jgi:hypothetical protein